MKWPNLASVAVLSVCAAAAAFASCSAFADGARERSAEGAQHARQAQHRSHTRTSTVERSPGSRSRSDTVTTGAGRTWQRDASASRDREAGTAERHVATQTPDGRTRTIDDHVQRTEDGHSRSTVYTDAQGRTATRDATVVNDPEAGTRQRDVEYTNREGETRTVSSTLTRSASPNDAD